MTELIHAISHIGDNWSLAVRQFFFELRQLIQSLAVLLIVLYGLKTIVFGSRK